jgi:nitronate monooxygenase
MGAISTPDLVVAAASAGAFPVVGTAGLSTTDILALLATVQARSTAPMGVNVVIPLTEPGMVEAVAPHTRLVDFYYGTPDDSLVAHAHAGGALASWQVGTVDHARAAVDAGCDLVAVRGTEGGGRMHGTRPLRPFLDEVVAAVDIPVLAAGGIATGRDLAAVLDAGAAGARMGTAFVATEESGAHAVYKQALIDAGPDDTVLCNEFSVLWPPGPEPSRVLLSSLMAASQLEEDVVGELPMGGQRFPVPRFAVMPPVTGATGHVEAFAMYAGTSAAAVERIEPAADLIARLVAEACEARSGE